MRKDVLMLLLAVTALALGAAATAQAATVGVTAGKPSEFKFSLSAKSVKHGTLTFTVTNRGTVPHDFKVCSKPTTKTADTCAGKATKMISPGQKATLSVTFKAAGSYEYLCTVPGHATAGMKGLLKVT